MPPIPIFNALADSTRCQIIEILRDGPVPVHQLAAQFKISRPAISRHLRVLKEAGLVKERKAGREIHYTFQPKKLIPARQWLEPIALATCRPPAKPGANLPKVSKRAAEALAPKSKPAVQQMGFDF